MFLELLASGMLNVFIPTTPNPTSGWYAVVAESEVINLPISIEDAFKILISGGIVAPTPALNNSNSSPENDKTHTTESLQEQSEILSTSSINQEKFNQEKFS